MITWGGGGWWWLDDDVGDDRSVDSENYRTQECVIDIQRIRSVPFLFFFLLITIIIIINYRVIDPQTFELERE